MRWLLALASAACAVPSARAADPVKPTAAQLEYFEAKVRPVLADHCYSCHGAKKQQGGLRLDTAAGIKARRSSARTNSRCRPTTRYPRTRSRRWWRG